METITKEKKTQNPENNIGTEEIGLDVGPSTIAITSKENYYGVAWDFKKDNYRLTGSLLNVSNMEDAISLMTVHNLVEQSIEFTMDKPKRLIGHYTQKFVLPLFYVRKIMTENEMIFEVSQLKLEGFEVWQPMFATGVLTFIEYCVFLYFKSSNIIDNDNNIDNDNDIILYRGTENIQASNIMRNFEQSGFRYQPLPNNSGFLRIHYTQPLPQSKYY